MKSYKKKDLALMYVYIVCTCYTLHRQSQLFLTKLPEEKNMKNYQNKISSLCMLTVCPCLTKLHRNIYEKLSEQDLAPMYIYTIHSLSLLYFT